VTGHATGCMISGNVYSVLSIKSLNVVLLVEAVYRRHLDKFLASTCCDVITMIRQKTRGKTSVFK